MKYSNFVKECLEQASKVALDGYGRVESKIKSEGNMQVLTETDLKVGQLIIDKIKSSFPDHNIIDEEAGVIDNGSQFTWTIDPIDGTANYASKIPMFGIMLGLLENDEPIAGGIVLPVFKEMYYAEKGLGAYCNDEKISVSQVPSLDRNLLAYLISSHTSDETITKECELFKKLIPSIMSLRTSNSTAFDGALVASGRYGIAMNRTSLIWDCVPLKILVEEAGGVFTGYDGEKIDFSNPTKKSKLYIPFCCGATDLHKQVQGLMI